MSGKSDKIIGIDLGTTNSVVAVIEGGQPRVIANKEGHRLTPSVVAFLDNGEVLVGQRARNQAITNPRHTIFSIKRFMGRRHGEVRQEEKLVPYSISGGGAPKPLRGACGPAPSARRTTRRGEPTNFPGVWVQRGSSAIRSPVIP